MARLLQLLQDVQPAVSEVKISERWLVRVRGHLLHSSRTREAGTVSLRTPSWRLQLTRHSRMSLSRAEVRTEVPDLDSGGQSG